jgi:hypothetical protein
MSLTGERQVIDGNGRTLQAEKTGYQLDMEGFGRSDKFRIRAGLDPSDLYSYQRSLKKND